MNQFRKAVFVVVYIRDKKEKIKYLILKRKLHWKGWEFVKGGLKEGEKIEDGVKRETKEETGFKPLGIKKFNFSEKYKYDKEYPDRKGIIGQKFSLYAAEVKKPAKGKIKLDKEEHSNYKWLSFKDALKKLTWPNQRKCLKIVKEWLKSLKSSGPAENSLLS